MSYAMLQASEHFFHSEQRSSAVACLRFLLMAFALNIFSVVAFSQTTYFVAMNGSDGADGSATNPLATIQRALDPAV
jgi:hypothetical protein